MNLGNIIPTQKVTAFVLGAALAVLIFWILGPDNANIITEPDATVQTSAAIVVGFIVAWVVPEGAWAKLRRHTEGDTVLPEHEDEVGH